MIARPRDCYRSSPPPPGLRRAIAPGRAAPRDRPRAPPRAPGPRSKPETRGAVRASASGVARAHHCCKNDTAGKALTSAICLDRAPQEEREDFTLGGTKWPFLIFLPAISEDAGSTFSQRLVNKTLGLRGPIIVAKTMIQRLEGRLGASPTGLGCDGWRYRRFRASVGPAPPGVGLRGAGGARGDRWGGRGALGSGCAPRRA